MSELRNTARRLSSATAIAAIGIAVALGTTACGAGQISQTANQLPAVNGASAKLGSLELRDVQVLYPAQNADEVFDDGGPFQVSFVIANEDPVINDKLLKITPSKGDVTIVGDAEIVAGQALRAGNPVGLLIPSDSPATEDQERITVTLDNTEQTVAAGLTTELTFTFEKAGDVTVRTPVDTGAMLPRQDKARQAEPPAYDQLHEEGH